MNFEALIFYGLSIWLILGAVFTILAQTAVHSVLFLILTFINASGLFILLGAEFLALSTVVIYIGAVAVLFLFVVMTLDTRFKSSTETIAFFKPFGLLMGLIFGSELIYVISSYKFTSVEKPLFNESNIHAIGNVLYTDFIFLFQTAGLILLVAMIGAIVLTYTPRKKNLKHQDPTEQINRTKEETLKIVKVSSRKGISS